MNERPGDEMVTIDWTEVVARSATFPRSRLAVVWPVRPGDIEPGSLLAGILSGAAVDMNSDLGTERVTITEVSEGDQE